MDGEKDAMKSIHIYDTGQQEAWLCWPLLKDFGHHVTYPSSKGMLVEETWHGTCIIWQQGVWVHYVDIEFFISIIMFSPHDLYDGGVRRQHEILLIWLLSEEYGLYFSILCSMFQEKGMTKSK